MSFLEKDFREIITKAVIGKGKKFYQATHTVSPSHKPTSILGCWVINHLYNAKQKSEDTVEENVSYDINIWYSYNDNTKTDVITERVNYTDYIPLSVKDDHTINDDYDVIYNVIQQPNCLECEIAMIGDMLQVEVEREFLDQVIGETKIYVKVEPKGYQYGDDEDDWDFEVTDGELLDVDPDFLKTESKD